MMLSGPGIWRRWLKGRLSPPRGEAKPELPLPAVDEPAGASTPASPADPAVLGRLSNVSRDMGEQLHNILGLVQLCLVTEPTNEQREYLVQALAVGERLRKSLGDLHELSTIEAGGASPTSTMFDLRGLLFGVAETMQSWVLGKPVEVSWDFGSGLPDLLYGDFARLRKVLLELGAQLLQPASARAVRLSCHLERQESSGVVLRFTFSGDVALSAQSEAAAELGLALSRGLIGMMGGQLRTEHPVGQGTAFHFFLHFQPGAERSGTQPAAAADVEPAAAIEAGWQVRGASWGTRVLLVDDNLVTRFVMQAMLERMGLHVTETANGVGALQRLRDGSYDLVLMDMQMPDMDGCEATQMIRSDPAHRSLPIIAVTANASAEAQAECRRAGMNDFVAKPVGPQQLAEVMSRHLAGIPSAAGGPDVPARRGCDAFL